MKYNRKLMFWVAKTFAYIQKYCIIYHFNFNFYTKYNEKPTKKNYEDP